jgi:hypothetical protein
MFLKKRIKVYRSSFIIVKCLLAAAEKSGVQLLTVVISISASCSINTFTISKCPSCVDPLVIGVSIDAPCPINAFTTAKCPFFASKGEKN